MTDLYSVDNANDRPVSWDMDAPRASGAWQTVTLNIWFDPIESKDPREWDFTDLLGEETHVISFEPVDPEVSDG